MKIEVGKAYQSRGGVQGFVERHVGYHAGMQGSLFPFQGVVGDVSCCWNEDGLAPDKSAGWRFDQELGQSPFDLISPWEDSPTQIKSESNVAGQRKAEDAGNQENDHDGNPDIAEGFAGNPMQAL